MAVIPFEPDNEAFDFELLFTDRLLLAVSSKHPLADRPVVTMADVAREVLVTMPPESAAWTTIKRAFEQAGLPFRPALQSRNSMTITALVRAGYGVAFVTELLTRTLPSPGITLRDLGCSDLQRRIGMISAKGRAIPPAVAAFRALLREKVHAGSHPPAAPR